jgi:hypothetical protein
MDASPTQSQSMSLVLEIDRSQDGRLEGQLRSQITDAWRPFSGVLELLKVLEETLDVHEGIAPIDPKEGIEI